MTSHLVMGLEKFFLVVVWFFSIALQGSVSTRRFEAGERYSYNEEVVWNVENGYFHENDFTLTIQIYESPEDVIKTADTRVAKRKTSVVVLQEKKRIELADARNWEHEFEDIHLPINYEKSVPMKALNGSLTRIILPHGHSGQINLIAESIDETLLYQTKATISGPISFRYTNCGLNEPFLKCEFLYQSDPRERIILDFDFRNSFEIGVDPFQCVVRLERKNVIEPSTEIENIMESQAQQLMNKFSTIRPEILKEEEIKNTFPHEKIDTMYLSRFRYVVPGSILFRLRTQELSFWLDCGDETIYSYLLFDTIQWSYFRNSGSPLVDGANPVLLPKNAKNEDYSKYFSIPPSGVLRLGENCYVDYFKLSAWINSVVLLHKNCDLSTAFAVVRPFEKESDHQFLSVDLAPYLNEYMSFCLQIVSLDKVLVSAAISPRLFYNHNVKSHIISPNDATKLNHNIDFLPVGISIPISISLTYSSLESISARFMVKMTPQSATIATDNIPLKNADLSLVSVRVSANRRFHALQFILDIRHLGIRGMNARLYLLVCVRTRFDGWVFCDRSVEFSGTEAIAVYDFGTTSAINYADSSPFEGYLVERNSVYVPPTPL